MRWIACVHFCVSLFLFLTVSKAVKHLTVKRRMSPHSECATYPILNLPVPPNPHLYHLSLPYLRPLPLAVPPPLSLAVPILTPLGHLCHPSSTHLCFLPSLVPHYLCHRPAPLTCVTSALTSDLCYWRHFPTLQLPLSLPLLSSLPLAMPIIPLLTCATCSLGAIP